jgi:hypothetical protein
MLAALGVSGSNKPSHSISQNPAGLPAPHIHQPGRIENEYSRYLRGDREALQIPPAITSITTRDLSAHSENQSMRMRPGDQINDWRLLAIVNIDSNSVGVFERTVSHRGVIAFVTEHGVLASVPKHIGKWSSIRPRQINTPDGVRFERATKTGPDVLGEYILNSSEDPCYENVAALGQEYVGWTLVANEESAPQHSLYLEPSGRSRELSPALSPAGLWAPDGVGPIFDPANLIGAAAGAGFSKRTLLAGYLPVANIAVWDPVQKSGYEVMVLLPPGKDTKPMAYLRGTIDERELAEYNKIKDAVPEEVAGIKVVKWENQNYMEVFWNCSAHQFFAALLAIWNRWRLLHEERMRVEIPDEWLLNGARAGITLCRCSYTGLDPTYQIGEGAYTKVPPSSHALFPVAHYEFIWAQQLWNQTQESDEYFQHYLEYYILPDGNFVYNTQEQVEAPLNLGVFLANSARGYFYAHDLPSLEKRLPILERMISYVLSRYEYSRTTYKSTDIRYGLIWGSPEADLGDPRKDTPGSHPLYYQNAIWVCRGLQEHAKCLAQAAKDFPRKDLETASTRYGALAHQMKEDIDASMRKALDLRSAKMKDAGIVPFTTDDLDHNPSELESYENHRFMEDWFLADWGDATLDMGHWRHRQLADAQILGMATSAEPWITSNFMSHGTLSYLIRQEDYRPFLLTLYALACYTSDSGNRYSPEDACIPGGHPLEGSAYGWSAVVNSTLQITLGLRWLLCYEDNHEDVCHLQKAAPKHWFLEGESISVQNCPTRFGAISWSTRAHGSRDWEISVDLPKGFSADLVIHIHPGDGEPLRTTSAGVLAANKITLPRNSLRGQAKTVTLRVS